MPVEVEPAGELSKMPKPIVLHLGSDIKYRHEYFEKELKSRFEVVKNEDLDRASFMQALRDKKRVPAPSPQAPPVNQTNLLTRP